jgi:hypothetical protein
MDRPLSQARPQGLEEQSRRPRTSPRHTPDHVVAAILDARRRHPSWGAKKLVAILSTRHPRWSWPARSTVCDILSRHYLVPKRRKRRAIGHPGKPTGHMTAPTEVWSADFKGHCKTGDGRYGYPLTITDGYSRFLLARQALSSTRVQGGETRLRARVQSMRPAAAHPHRPRRALCHQHPPPGCPNGPRGGSAWASCRSSSNLANRHRTAATSACIAP